jgi:hypothetical protein
MAQAKQLITEIAGPGGKGKGKFKGPYDLERLLGVTLPELCENVCPKEQKTKCDIKCIDWARKETIPPLQESELAPIVQKLAKFSHDAECACDAGNIFGKSCHVLCPSKDDSICAARGPELPSAAPGMKLDPWVGELVFHMGAWHASKAGCLWGMRESAGLITSYDNTDESQDRWDRDPFVKVSSQRAA